MRTFIFISTMVTGIAFGISCRKTDSRGPLVNNPPDDCAVLRAPVDGQIIEGQYIVAYKPTAITTLSTSRIASFTHIILERNKISSTALRQSFAGEPGGFIARLSAQEVQRLLQDDAIGAIEQDRIIAFGACFEVVEPKSITWNVARVGYGDGTGKTAWIIDSGIDFAHPDLNADVARSRSFVPDITSAADDNGHGTAVAGIIGARNNSIGILGVAADATLVALKVFNQNGEATLSSVVQALGYINSNARAGDVVNMSLGEDQTSDILDKQVKSTAARGIFITIAAGNERKPAAQFSPGRANAPNIYTVSATDSLDNFASFSNYGNDVIDFAAPGVDVLSTYINGTYVTLSGTSMAAPHVAGLLLLNGKNIRISGMANNDPDGTPDPIAHK